MYDPILDRGTPEIGKPRALVIHADPRIRDNITDTLEANSFLALSVPSHTEASNVLRHSEAGEEPDVVVTYCGDTMRTAYNFADNMKKGAYGRRMIGVPMILVETPDYRVNRHYAAENGIPVIGSEFGFSLSRLAETATRLAADYRSRLGE